MRAAVIFLGMMCVSLGFVTPAFAQDALAAERFQLRARALGIYPAGQDSNNVTPIGGKADVDESYTPEVDVTYFFEPQWGLEFIAATAKHEVNYNTNTNLGTTWILPPTLSLQYHPLRGQDFSPYGGVGINYSHFYGEKDASGFNDLKVEGGWGYGAQLGFDYWLGPHWGINVDAKKLWLNIDADLSTGGTALHADVDLDPWIIGTGISYRF